MLDARRSREHHGRSKLEQLTENFLSRTKKPCEDCLKDSGLKALFSFPFFLSLPFQSVTMTGLQISSNCNLNKCSLQLQELANILTRLPNLGINVCVEVTKRWSASAGVIPRQPIARLGFADGRDW